MSSAAFMRMEKLSGNGIWQKAARHNKRAIQTELGASGHIDPTRSHLNVSLIGPQTADEVAALAKAKILAAGITKVRKNGVLGIELVFSLPKGHQIDLISYFTACAQWSGTEFGGQGNIVSVDIHRDEAQDHAHVLLVPLFAGHLRGSDAVGNKKRLGELQTRFYREVASNFGFSKPRSRLGGNNKAQLVRLVLEKLRKDAVIRSAVWSLVREAVAHDPLPFAMLLGIDHSPPVKQLRTMAQIFTSKGKGARYEKPIGNQNSEPYREAMPDEEQTLGLCREFDSPSELVA